MSDLDYLILLPLVLSAVLIPLRRQRAVYWWIAFLVTELVIGAFLLKGADAPSSVRDFGPFLLYALPIACMFAVLRLDLFRRRPILMILAGPASFLAGVSLSLAVVVGLGLMEP